MSDVTHEVLHGVYVLKTGQGMSFLRDHSARMYLELPLWQWGASNVYLLVLSSRKPHCHNGDADMFRL